MKDRVYKTTEAQRERSRKAYIRKKERMASDPEYRERIQAKARLDAKARRDADPDAARAYERAQHEKHREKRNAYSQRRRVEKGDELRAKERDAYYADLEASRKKSRDNARRRRTEMPDEVRENYRLWREANPERVRAYNSAYKAATRGAHISRADIEAVEEWQAIVMADPCPYTRERVACEHMDHIVPIAGGGEHKWHNLVGASASANQRKSDRSLLLFMRENLEEAA